MFRATVVALALVFAGSASQAATCAAKKVSFFAENATEAFCVSGNVKKGVSGQFDAAMGTFGVTDWTLGDRTDNAGDQAVTFLTTPVLQKRRFGDWALNSLNGFNSVMLVFQTKKAFGAFLVDPANLAGDWKSVKKLLSVSVWYSPSSRNGDTTPPNPAAVPVPAAGLMLAAGLGGLAMLRRRRRA